MIHIQFGMTYFLSRLNTKYKQIQAKRKNKNFCFVKRANKTTEQPSKKLEASEPLVNFRPCRQAVVAAGHSRPADCIQRAPFATGAGGGPGLVSSSNSRTIVTSETTM